MLSKKELPEHQKYGHSEEDIIIAEYEDEINQLIEKLKGLSYFEATCFLRGSLRALDKAAKLV